MSLNFEKLWSKIEINPLDFTTWTSILEIADKQENPNRFREAFDKFLLHFPYCYGYWKKYAELVKHKDGRDRALEVYERGVYSIPLSIDLWVAYAEVYMEAHRNDEDFEKNMRAIYEKGIDMVGLEFRSDPFWEHYISWETNSNRLVHARRLYERLLAIPTQMYFQNRDSFKRLIEDNTLLEVMSPEEIAPFHGEIDAKVARAVEEGLYAGILLPGDDEDENTSGPKHYMISMEEEETLKATIIASRDKIYQASYQQIMKRWYFEENIRRPYFHVKPLDEAQLANWANYLSFEEAELKRLNDLNDVQRSQLYGSHAGVRRVLILYERALVACALYEHIWIRYARYLETVVGDLDAALRVFHRACNIHLRFKPTIHFHWAMFMDKYPRLNARDCLIDQAKDNKIWPLMPKITDQQDTIVIPKSGLDILTALEKRLPDSALVCARRVDFMRRGQAPLIDQVLVLRSGINRLRFTAQDHHTKAYEVTGAAASTAAQRSLTISQQAKAGSAFLACKMARLVFHCIKADDGIPIWKLMLNSNYLKRSTNSNTNGTHAKRAKFENDSDNDDDDDDCKIEEVVNGMPNDNGLDESAIQPNFTGNSQLDVTILQVPDARTLREEDKKLLTPYQAGAEILNEALDYDSHNERVFASWLDLIYQHKPIDVTEFVKVCDRAIQTSLLPEEVKLSFMQRKLQFLEEFSPDVVAVSMAYEDYMAMAKSMSNQRQTDSQENEAEGQAQQMYPMHGFQDMLNVAPGAVLSGKASHLQSHAQTPMATYAPMTKSNPTMAMNAMRAANETLGHQVQNQMANSAVAYGHFTAGAYEPMAIAQGDVSGMPPIAPAVRLMHPPMGDNLGVGLAQNEAWRKAAAAVGQQMTPHIIDHTSGGRK